MLVWSFPVPWRWVRTILPLGRVGRPVAKALSSISKMYKIQRTLQSIIYKDARGQAGLEVGGVFGTARGTKNQNNGAVTKVHKTRRRLNPSINSLFPSLSFRFLTPPGEQRSQWP